MSFLERFFNRDKLSVNSTRLLLSSSVWASGLNGPTGMVVYDASYMYVANSSFGEISNGAISKLNLADGSIIDASWATGFNGPLGLAIDASYIYVANSGVGGEGDISGNTISKINLADASVDLNWATGFNSALAGLVIDGSYIYVANIGFIMGSPDEKISKVSLADGSIIDASWATGLSGPFDLLINGSYMYVSNNFNSTISKINMADGSIANADWATGLGSPSGLAIYNTYMYVANLNYGTISQINLADGSIANPNWAGFEDGPFFLDVYNTDLYVSLIGSGTIYRISLEPEPVPISDICFRANTQIETDQGIIAINKINPKINTIHNSPIIGITKTVTLDKYLICFKPNALGLNYPSEKTVMSKKHQVFYNGKMIEADKFVGHFENVHKIKYNGEILYNVLMETHSKIRANNMICETLHPNNVIAKLYSNNLDENNKNNIIVIMNECINKNDYSTYKKTISQLH